MQRIGIVSPEASGLSWWSRLQDEGFDVKVFIAAAEAKTVGDGIVPKAKSWNDMIAFLKGGKSLALFDSSREGKKADLLRTMGIPVVGGGAFCDRLEEDRAFGESVAAAIGCATPEKHDFTTVGQAIAFAKTMKGGWYFKSDTYLKSDATYGSDNPEEMVRYLEFLRECYGDRVKNMMQKKIDGAALSTGCWWNGRTFVGPFEGTIERKKFLNDDLGPATGCSLNAVWFYDDDEPTIAKALGWKNLEAVFRKYNAPPCLYDMNGIVKQGKAYFLEWTPRLGWCSEATSQALIEGSLGEMLVDLADGKLREVPANRDEIAYGVRVSVPPYPTEEIPKDAEQSAEGTPVWGMDSLWEGDFAAYCLRKADKGTYEAADPSGLLGVGLATGTTLTALHRSVMGFLKRDLVAPAKQYRTDGVQAISDDAKKIAQNGIRLPAALTR